MAGIRDKVAIVGMGCTKFGERWGAGVDDLLVEAASEAYEDAGIDASDVQAAWLGTQSSGYSGQILSKALKLEYVPITRVENFCATGADAFRNGCYAVAAGIYDVVMVAGVEKLKDVPYTGLSVVDPMGSYVFPQVPPPVQFALAATRYFHHYGLSYEQGKLALARIAVKNHHNGALNPKAHFQKEITLEQAMSSPMVAWPLGLFDCCGVSDGSAVAIITRPEIAKRFRDDYIMVKGMGVVCSARQGLLQDDYDFNHFDENVNAARIAYGEAGITDPPKQIDHSMVHDCFTITELITYEDMGWCPPGTAKEHVENGFFDLEGGEIAVNVDGGLKSFGHPIGASGIRMIYEVYKQLQGKAGKRQRKNPEIGAIHNIGGYPGSFTAAVGIFGKRD